MCMYNIKYVLLTTKVFKQAKVSLYAWINTVSNGFVKYIDAYLSTRIWCKLQIQAMT